MPCSEIARSSKNALYRQDGEVSYRPSLNAEMIRIVYQTNFDFGEEGAFVNRRPYRLFRWSILPCPLIVLPFIITFNS